MRALVSTVANFRKFPLNGFDNFYDCGHLHMFIGYYHFIYAASRTVLKQVFSDSFSVRPLHEAVPLEVQDSMLSKVTS